MWRTLELYIVVKTSAQTFSVWLTKCKNPWGISEKEMLTHVGLHFRQCHVLFFSYDTQWAPTKYVLGKIHYFRKLLVLKILFIIFHSYYQLKISELKNQVSKLRFKI